MARMPVHRALGKVLRKKRKGSTTMTPDLFVIDKTAIDASLGQSFDFEVKTIDKNQAYLLTKDELEQFARDHHVYITKLAPSSVEGVTWAWCSGRVRADLTGLVDDVYTAPATLGDANFDGLEKDSFLLLSGWFQKQIGREVVVHTDHFRQAAYRAEGPFRIHLWASANGHNAAIVAPRIWDIPIGSAQYRTHGINPKINDDDVRVPLMDGTRHVAEVYPNAMYLNFDITRSGSLNDLRIYFTTLQKVVEILNSKTVWPTPETISAKHRARFMAFVEKGLEARTSRTKHALESAQQRVKDLRQMLLEAERDIFAIENSKTPEIARQRFADEFTRLRTGQVKHIKTVNVHGENVIIEIEDIYIKHPRTKLMHKLGNFEVSISPRYGSLNYIRNKTRVYGDRHCHHPHVFGIEGGACLGNIADEVLKYISHFEIEATANLLVGYLQSCADDHLAYLNNFPTI